MTLLISNEVPEGDIDGINVIFTPEFTYVTGSTMVRKDTRWLVLDTDYYETDEDDNPSNSVIKMASAPLEGEVVIMGYQTIPVIDEDSADIREEILICYPQMIDCAKNKLDKINIASPGSGLTVVNILNKFIQIAKKEHDIDEWGTKYQHGVVLLTCHFLSEGTPEGRNTGIITSSEIGTDSGSKTQYLAPNNQHLGRFGTTDYGIAWGAMAAGVGPKIEVSSI